MRKSPAFRLLGGTGRLVFAVSPQGSYLDLTLLVPAGSLALMACGYLPGSLLRRSRAVHSVTTLIAFPMMFLGQSYFPTDGAPLWMQYVGQATPLYT